MTGPSKAVERSLPHEMVAWKAAAEDLAAQRDALAHRVEQLEAALKQAVLAMRAPLDDWKGEVERAALDAARAALGVSP